MRAMHRQTATAIVVALGLSLASCMTPQWVLTGQSKEYSLPHYLSAGGCGRSVSQARQEAMTRLAEQIRVNVFVHHRLVRREDNFKEATFAETREMFLSYESLAGLLFKRTIATPSEACTLAVLSHDHVLQLFLAERREARQRIKESLSLKGQHTRQELWLLASLTREKRQIHAEREVLYAFGTPPQTLALFHRIDTAQNLLRHDLRTLVVIPRSTRLAAQVTQEFVNAGFPVVTRFEGAALVLQGGLKEAPLQGPPGDYRSWVGYSGVLRLVDLRTGTIIKTRSVLRSVVASTEDDALRAVGQDAEVQLVRPFVASMTGKRHD